MNESDDKLTTQANSLDNVKADESGSARTVPSENGNAIGDIARVAFKAVAVALSLVLLITSIFTVALPLKAMRIFNNLGMYERALVSGTRYIDGELKREKVDVSMIGKYYILLSNGINDNQNALSLATSIPSSLNNADFIEALEVCINLSDKLMRESAEKDDIKSAKYFAERLEKYTRYYSAVFGVSTVFDEKDAKNKQTFSPALHPFVYSVRHALMTQNFRARYYMDEFDEMLCNGGTNGYVLRRTDNNINTFNGTNVYNTDGTLNRTIMNNFVDYVDQLSEYVAIEFERCGMTDAKLNELEETRKKYAHALDGSEFKLFLTKENGYTRLYQGLKSFPSYAQAAVSFSPQNADEQLMQLFWVQKLATAANRFWNMEILVWFNRESYGVSMDAIDEEYGAHAYRNFINVRYPGNQQNTLEGVYDIFMKNYIDNFQG